MLPRWAADWLTPLWGPTLRPKLARGGPLGRSRSVAPLLVPPPVALLAGSLPAHRAGERPGPRRHRGGPAERFGLLPVRGRPRVRRLPLLREPATQGRHPARCDLVHTGAVPHLGAPDVRLLPSDQSRRFFAVRGAAEGADPHGEAGVGPDAGPVGPRSSAGVVQSGLSAPAQGGLEQRDHTAGRADGRSPRRGDRSIRDRISERWEPLLRPLHHLGLCAEDQPGDGHPQRVFRSASPGPGRLSRVPGPGQGTVGPLGDRYRQRVRRHRTLHPSSSCRMVDPGRSRRTRWDHRGRPGVGPTSIRGRRDERNVERPRGIPAPAAPSEHGPDGSPRRRRNGGGSASRILDLPLDGCR